jgi:FlaA1/EpsC-like NDP-sugar epimerase
VLASRGSVIPLFHDQIRSGGPVTITDSRMTRFLLSLNDAVDTTFEAMRSALAGEIYIPAAPGARMTDIARALIGGRKIEIVESGVRPGEKFDEILVSEEEVNHTIRRGNYFVVRPALPELAAGHGPLTPALQKEFSSGDFVLDFERAAELLARNGLLIDSPVTPGAELLR